MRTTLAVISLFALCSTSAPSRAQEPGAPRTELKTESEPAPRSHFTGQDALTQYLERHMELRFEQGMFSAFEVYQNGAPIDLGFFGGGADEIFHGSPDALEAMSTYQIMRAVGFPLWLAGTLALTVQIAILLVDVFEDTDILVNPSGPKPAFFGLLIGGAAVGITGGTLMQVAPSYLNDAVLYHNRDLLLELRGQRAELPRPAAMRLSLSF